MKKKTITTLAPKYAAASLDPDKLNELSKKELLKVVKDAILPISNPEKYKQIVKAAMPDLVKEMDTKEDMASSIMESSQEMMMVIFDCLRRYHGWNDKDLKQLNKEITDVLTGVKEFEDAGLSMLSPHSVKIVGDNVQELGISGLLGKIAEVRYQKTRMIKAGIEVPKLVDEKPFVKQLKEKNG